MASSTRNAPQEKVGPPLALLALGFLCVAVGLLLVFIAESTKVHLAGYVAGSVVPLLIIGMFHRSDLQRRRSPYYAASALVRPGLVLVAAAAIVLAGLHVWPIATDLAS